MSLILSPFPSPLLRNTFFELFSLVSVFFNLKFPFGSSVYVWFLSLNFLLLFSHLCKACSQMLAEAFSLWQLHNPSMIPASVTAVLTPVASPVLIPFEIFSSLAVISGHPLGIFLSSSPSVSADSSDPPPGRGVAPAPYGPQVGTWGEPHLVWHAPFSGVICSSGPTGMLGRKLPSPSAYPPTMDTCPEKVAVITRVQLSTHVHVCGNSETKCEGSVPKLSPRESALSGPGRHGVCVCQLLPCASSLLTWSPGSMGVDSETEARGHTLRFYCPEVPKPWLGTVCRKAPRSRPLRNPRNYESKLKCYNSM